MQMRQLHYTRLPTKLNSCAASPAALSIRPPYCIAYIYIWNGILSCLQLYIAYRSFTLGLCIVSSTQHWAGVACELWSSIYSIYMMSADWWLSPACATDCTPKCMSPWCDCGCTTLLCRSRLHVYFFALITRPQILICCFNAQTANIECVF